MAENVADIVQKSTEKTNVVSLDYLLVQLVAEQRRPEISIEVDSEMWDKGLVSLSELLATFAAATCGDWQPAGAEEDWVDDEDTFVLEFAHDGGTVRWKFAPEDAFDGLGDEVKRFAAQHLPGRFIGCDPWFYLPAGLVDQLHALVHESERVWPSPDELIAIFRQVDDPPPRADPWGRWRSMWGSTVKCVGSESRMLRVNELSTRGERPLHVLVAQARAMGNALLRRERRSELAHLIGTYGADPNLLDVNGMTAFDYAGGDEDLRAALSTPRATEERDEPPNEWYFSTGPIG